MNFIAGLSSIPAITFLVGSLISLLPGAVARGIVGESLTQVLLAPTKETYLWLALGVLLWVGIVAGTHMAMKKFGDRDENTSEENEATP